MGKKTVISIIIVFIILVVAAIVLIYPHSRDYSRSATSTAQTGNISPVTGADFEDRVIARIDGESIMLSEIEERVSGLTNKFREINPDMQFPEDRLQKMRKEFLDRLIKERILENASKSANIEVTDADIDERIEELQKFFGEDEAARKRFQDGIDDMDRFRNEVAKQIRIDKYFDSVAGDMSVTEKEIEEYYNANPDRFVNQEQVKAQQIVWKTPPSLSENYDQRKAEIMKTAQEVKQKADEGVDFTDLVKQYSEDENSVARSGDVGWMSKGRIPQFLNEALFPAEIGKIIGPLEGPNGIYIFKITDKKDPGKISLEEASERIQKILESQKKNAFREKMYEDLHAKAKIEILL
ncbi:peptidylprolyl isomerase [bacterium]|nr:peptidylprolyl isomerase [candidate division CSSED10-310 bacterium]